MNKKKKNGLMIYDFDLKGKMSIHETSKPFLF